MVQALAKSETVSETASYSITDNQGGTATTGKVTAKIQGVNDKPSAVDFKGSFEEGSGSSSQTFDAMWSASDVDSDVTADNKNDKLTITLGSTATSHGTFALTADEHKISYTFDDDDSLDDLDTGSKTTETIKYTVTDQHGATTEKAHNVLLFPNSQCSQELCMFLDIACRVPELGEDKRQRLRRLPVWTPYRLGNCGTTIPSTGRP